MDISVPSRERNGSPGGSFPRPGEYVVGRPGQGIPERAWEALEPAFPPDRVNPHAHALPKTLRTPCNRDFRSGTAPSGHIKKRLFACSFRRSAFLVILSLPQPPEETKHCQGLTPRLRDKMAVLRGAHTSRSAESTTTIASYSAVHA